MRNIIIKLQKSDTWRIQLTIVINFISSTDVNEERLMHSKSALYDNANEVVNELFESLVSRYPTGLETSMRQSDFVFD